MSKSKKRKSPKGYEVISVDKKYRYGVFDYSPVGKQKAKDYIILLKKKIINNKEKFKIHIV